MKEQCCNTIKETLGGNQETWDSQLHCILIAKEDTNSFGVIYSQKLLSQTWVQIPIPVPISWMILY